MNLSARKEARRARLDSARKADLRQEGGQVGQRILQLVSAAATADAGIQLTTGNADGRHLLRRCHHVVPHVLLTRNPVFALEGVHHIR